MTNKGLGRLYANCTRQPQVEEGNRRFPSGMTNKGLGRLYTNCYFALKPHYRRQLRHG
jgi:hypothetical protein